MYSADAQFHKENIFEKLSLIYKKKLTTPTQKTDRWTINYQHRSNDKLVLQPVVYAVAIQTVEKSLSCSLCKYKFYKF